MFFEAPTRGFEAPKGGGAVRTSVFALAALTALFVLFVGPLVALAGRSGLL